MKTQPQYSQLAEILIRKVNAGIYPVGSHLPPEIELCEVYGLSRNTVRSAIRVLQDMRLVSRHAGIGTIVRAQSAAPKYVLEVTSLSELFPGIELTEQVLLSESEIVADEPLSQLLNCAVGQQWMRFATLRLLKKGQLPVACSDIYVLPDFRTLGPKLNKLARPSHEALEMTFGVQIAEVVQQTDAQLLTSAVAKVLNLPSRSAGLHVVRRFLDEHGHALMVTDNRYPAGQASYSLRLRLSGKPLSRG